MYISCHNSEQYQCVCVCVGMHASGQGNPLNERFSMLQEKLLTYTVLPYHMYLVYQVFLSFKILYHISYTIYTVLLATFYCTYTSHCNLQCPFPFPLFPFQVNSPELIVAGATSCVQVVFPHGSPTQTGGGVT